MNSHEVALKRRKQKQSPQSCTPGDERSNSFVDVLREHSLNRHDHPALIFLPNGEGEGERLTYADLDSRARSLAAFLQTTGLSGHPVLLMMPSSVEYVVAFLGCLYAGSIAVPAYPALEGSHVERLAQIARDCNARAALYLKSDQTGSPPLASPLAQDGTECRLLSFEDIAMAPPEQWVALEFEPDTVAFLQYTSGSTGSPRGVMITHGNLLAYFRHVKAIWGNDSSEVGVTWLPMFHDMGIGSVLHPLYLGGSIVVLPPLAFLQKPLRWLHALSRYRATMCAAPNFAYELCVAAAERLSELELDLSAWKFACNAAEPVRAQTLERFTARFAAHGFRAETFAPAYGLAEAVLSVTITPRDTTAPVFSVSALALAGNEIAPAKDGEKAQTLVGCGRPHAETRLVIVHPETHGICADGTVGEIWISGPTVAAGYWHRNDETEAVFHAHTATGEGPFLRTGDLGVLLEGELYVTGRIKDLIIIRGGNHYPQDIEHTVVRSSTVLEADRGAAFSVEEQGEERLVVVQEVRRRNVKSLQGAEVAEAMRQAIVAEHGVDPHAIVLVKPASIPLTSSGKIQRQVCKVNYLEARLEPLYEWRARLVGDAPRLAAAASGGVSYETVSAWIRAAIAHKKSLPAEEISLDQPFASFGLDSLEIVALSGELSAWLDQELSPTLVYDYPTIRLYAEKVAGGSTPQPSPLEVRAPVRSTIVDEDVAIVGMACRFPGADSIDAFWRLLESGTDAITEVPPDRWAVDDHYSAEWPKPGKMNTRWGGFLGDVDRFDAAFFNISPLEAEGMDPQQRLLLQATWHALEDAGIPASALAGSNAGVFIGANGLDYRQLQLRDGGGTDPYSGLGSGLAITANRISYFLDLHGPSWTVDSACSSSLVALHQARASLLGGECDVAIVGGVNLVLAPENTVLSSQANLLSPDGRCKTFDVGANGFVRSEGCGVVVLKRHADAVHDHDRVLACVAGSAVNQDGRSNGLTAPNGLAQRAVIRQALASAGVGPQSVGYVEAQGTGTQLGDSIEFGALKEVYDVASEAAPTLWVSTVKTNIGHLEPASGVAALIKVVLMLRHRKIPPHLHLRQLNPLISLDGSRLAIPDRLQAWHTLDGAPRIAAVSAFGIGGANAHVVVREAPAQEAVADTPRPMQLLTLSAKTKRALTHLATACAELLAGDAVNEPLEALCHTANTRRTHHDHRLALPVQSVAQAQERLQRFSRGEAVEDLFEGFAPEMPEGRTAFVFSGQDPQALRCGRGLYAAHAGFRSVFDRCDAAYRDLTGESLAEMLFGSGAATTDRQCVAQPALFAVQCALAALWQSCGIQAQGLIGHGAGELAAACVGGVFGLEDGIRLAVHRGRLMDEGGRSGAAFSVQGLPETVRQLLAESPQHARVIAHNSAQHIVVAGDAGVLQRWLAPWLSAGIVMTRLPGVERVDAPPSDGGFERVARAVDYRVPAIPVASGLTGQLAGAEIATADHWLRSVSMPVLFGDGMQALAEAGCSVFVEIGPHPTLAAAGRHSVPNGLWLHSLRRGEDDCIELSRSLARWYAAGGVVDWPRRAQAQCATPFVPPKPVSLPAYPFDLQRYWFKAKAKPLAGALRNADGLAHPIAGQRLELSSAGDRLYFENVLNEDWPAFLADHHIFGTAVLPGAALVEWMLAAAHAVHEGDAGAWSVDDLVVGQAVILGSDALRMQTAVIAGEGRYEVRGLSSRREGKATLWTEHVRAIVSIAAGDEATAPCCSPDVSERWPEVPLADYYEQLAQGGLQYGPLFRGLQRLWREGPEALARIEVVDAGEEAAYRLNPFALDACFHALGAFADLMATQQVLLPVSIRHLSVRGALPRSVWCHVRWHGGVGPGRYEADLTLHDDAWHEVVRIEGLQMADVSQEPAYASLYAALLGGDAGDQQASAEQARALRARIGEMESEEAKAQILDYLAGLAANVLKLDDAKRDDLQRGFRRARLNELGVDSLLGVQLRNRVQSEFGVDIPVQMFVGGSETAEIAGLIYRQAVINHLVTRDTEDGAAGAEDNEEFVV